MSFGAASDASAALDRLDEIGTREPKRRRQAEREPGDHRNRQRESDELPVEGQVERDRRRPRGAHDQERPAAPARDRQPGSAAKTRKQQTLRQQLPDEAPA